MINWDSVVDFFSGGADAAGSVAGEVAASNWDVSGFLGNLFEGANEGANEGTAQGALEKAVVGANEGASNAAQDTATSLLKEAPDKTSIADRFLTDAADNVYDPSNINPKAKNAVGRLREFWKTLDPDEKKILGTFGGAGLAGLAGAATESLKHSNREAQMRLQAELAGETAGSRRAAELAATQAANQVPGSVPFRRKPGAVLTNRAGQPVLLPTRAGIIDGAMHAPAIHDPI